MEQHHVTINGNVNGRQPTLPIEPTKSLPSTHHAVVAHGRVG